ncbi:hypothetical protein DIURU_000352 [Diutina rugosa]|uniref:GH16 domain-containing protein n=1 Tax=Diutina rugosa TaxID=5481 RepID=A0A642V527_DIURU|nr:uncharacterized protein DIURU_000352 [Diutina rugosa]KAA8907942.1 hypothetical protein DIURU_000352 [Diutina rugosa]
MFTRNLTHTSSSDTSAQSSVENPFQPEEEHERLIPNDQNNLQNSYPNSYQNSYHNGDSRYPSGYQNGDSRYPSGYHNRDTSGYPSSGSGSSESPDFNRPSSSGSLLPPQRPDHQRWSASPSIAYDPDSSPFGGYPAHQFPLSIEDKEPDDYLHNPDPVADAEYDKNRFWYDLKTMDTKSRNAAIAFVGMILAAVAVFVLIPVFTYSGVGAKIVPQRYEVLTLYQYPLMGGLRTSLIDPDTPQEYMTKKAQDGSDWTLVFSDEFNAEGRTFYDGDDQFWQAVDLHYDATKDLEWYDPDAATTAEGTLNLRMDAFKNHDMFYRSGMVQSWNKMCFTQGHIEISARLPNYGNISGLWPGLWTMGNLGRPGYLATTDGVWPYTYESCDAGITANQSSPDGISFLPGQRLNSCTCKGESHPNPGTGRGAPEIDILEGEIHEENGRVSQSYQVAPYDIWYMPDYEFVEIHNKSVTVMNTYAGGPFQQAISAVTRLNRSWYEFGDGPHHFQTYAFEYLHDNDDGYITWFVGQDPTMTMRAKALHPNGNVGWRRISKEPMSVIMNLGISNNWAYIDWNGLNFPATHRIDYVRIYQPKDQINTGCDPTDYPTQNYIQAHPDIYSNVNLTSFTKAGYPWPKNSLLGCE